SRFTRAESARPGRGGVLAAAVARPSRGAVRGAPRAPPARVAPDPPAEGDRMQPRLLEVEPGERKGDPPERAQHSPREHGAADRVFAEDAADACAAPARRGPCLVPRGALAVVGDDERGILLERRARLDRPDQEIDLVRELPGVPGPEPDPLVEPA